MKQLANEGFFLPTTELPEDATESVTNNRINRYSHFALSNQLTKNYIRGSVRYQEIAPLYPNLSNRDLRNIVDHKPLLIALDID